MIKICSLGSGSKGNCTYIESENIKILIDAGFPLYEIEKRLNEIEINPFDIDYILSTHNHIDHIKSVDSFCRRYKSKAVVHASGVSVLERQCKNSDIMEFNDKLCLNDLEIQNIPLCHDSDYCSGFKISNGKKTVAVMTDLGQTKDIENYLTDVDMLMVESNHDVEMLKNGRYPAYLKRRILSNVGHISNLEAAQLVLAAVLLKTKQVMLMHLSEENNLPELAFSVMIEKLRQVKLSEKDVRINVAPQHTLSKIVIL